MRILGVDPGSNLMGLAILEETERGNKLLDYRTITCKGGTKYGRFVSLDRQLTAYCLEWKPDEAAFEKGFTGFGGKQSFEISALVVGEARGAAMLSVARQSIPIFEYSQGTVKKAATGKGNTKKRDVEYWIRAQFQLPGVMQEDAADAVACAMTHSMRRER